MYPVIFDEPSDRLQLALKFFWDGCFPLSTSKDISKNIMPETVSLRDVLERLNEGVGGIVLIVDANGVLIGVATDGDVRRAILSGSNMDTPATAIIQKSFTVGLTRADRTANLNLMSATVRHLPIIDDDGRPVDMMAWTDLWRMPLVQPSLGGNETKYVSDCLSTGWVSSQGAYISKFEAAFTEYMGTGLSRCTSSGTTALHLALLGLEIGPGDEVIVPDLTFGATANAVIHAGAQPVFVDVDPVTWTIDPSQVRAAITNKTKAVIPVHLYGHPCEMEQLVDVCRTHNLKIIEDCAESLGAEYKGQKVGLFGDVSCFSFFANKIITTGEGGMVWCRDEAIFDRISEFRDHGMSKTRRYWHNVPGYNYRMTNIQAAVGLAQIEQIQRFLETRNKIANRYTQHLKNIKGLVLPPVCDWAKSICWLYTVQIDEQKLGVDIKTLTSRLLERGIETRNVFYPLHDQPAFKAYRHLDSPVSAQLSARGLSLPTSNDMTVDDVDAVCDAFISVLGTSVATATAAS